MKHDNFLKRLRTVKKVRATALSFKSCHSNRYFYMDGNILFLDGQTGYFANLKGCSVPFSSFQFINRVGL